MRGIAISFISAISAANAYTVIVHEKFMNKNIDALVFPGQYKSHMHTFFGSDAITKDKPTSAELQQGCASGENPNDLSVYWIPTLYYTPDSSTRTEVPIMRFSTYYENIGYADAPIPQDFSAIAGNALATTQSEAETAGTNGLSWFCEGDAGEDKDDAAFPSTTCSTHLQVILRFPDCVDPASLNSTYSSGSFGNTNYCPTGWNRIPQLRFSIRYDLRKTAPDGWSGPAPLELACGSSYCMHGDFINGWFEDAAEEMLRVGADKREFAQVDGEHGDGKSGPTCEATDADPSGGTDDYDTSVQMMGEKLRRALRRARSLGGARRA